MAPNFANLFAWCDLHATRWARWGALGRARYYDRQGFPIPGDQGRAWVGSATRKWARLLEHEDYRVVARDELPDGSCLSTIWLGLDHAWHEAPLFFETIRLREDGEAVEFPDVRSGETTTTQLRAGSEEEALALHHAIVRQIRLREGH